MRESTGGIEERKRKKRKIAERDNIVRNVPPLFLRLLSRLIVCRRP